MGEENVWTCSVDFENLIGPAVQREIAAAVDDFANDVHLSSTHFALDDPVPESDGLVVYAYSSGWEMAAGKSIGMAVLIRDLMKTATHHQTGKVRAVDIPKIEARLKAIEAAISDVRAMYEAPASPLIQSDEVQG